jgi:hypothetical protein
VGTSRHGVHEVHAHKERGSLARALFGDGWIKDCSACGHTGHRKRKKQVLFSAFSTIQCRRKAETTNLERFSVERLSTRVAQADWRELQRMINCPVAEVHAIN